MLMPRAFRLLAVLAPAFLVGAGCTSNPEDEISLRQGSPAVSVDAKKTEPVALAVAPPPFSEDIFPCSDCHEDMEVNTKRRKLEEEHENIKLDHGPRDRWCFDCHNPDDRDTLRLASGAVVPFTESYRLCGQCHGPKLRDWQKGIHGKRTGSWDGDKRYLLCASCHNPHAPHFPPLSPLPPPDRPGEIR